MSNSTEPKEQNFVAGSAEFPVIVSRKEAKEKGLKYYFTGKPCKHGHTDKRVVSQKSCYTCAKSHSRKYNSKKIVKTRLAKDRREKRASNPDIKKRECELRKKQSYKDVRKQNRKRPEVKLREKKYKNEYSKRPEVKNRDSEYGKSYYAKTKEKRLTAEFREKSKISMRKHRKTEIGILRGIIDHLIYRILNKDNCKRSGTADSILGYSNEDLIKHFELLFVEGMSWVNHGEWHIDHIKPIKAFFNEGVTDPKIINSLSNLQPLWAKDNLSKGAKYND